MDFKKCIIKRAEAVGNLSKGESIIIIFNNGQMWDTTYNGSMDGTGNLLVELPEWIEVESDSKFTEVDLRSIGLILKGEGAEFMRALHSSVWEVDGMGCNIDLE